MVAGYEGLVDINMYKLMLLTALCYITLLWIQSLMVKNLA